MRLRVFVFVLAACCALAGQAWAISSEPVYIKTSEQLQAFKAQLESLQGALKAKPGLFDGQEKLLAIVDAEVTRISGIKRVDPGMKIEVTKLYRAIDADGRSLATKNRAAGQSLLEAMGDCIDLVSTANDYAPRWKF